MNPVWKGLYRPEDTVYADAGAGSAVAGNESSEKGGAQRYYWRPGDTW
jgi:hypothetical protein